MSELFKNSTADVHEALDAIASAAHDIYDRAAQYDDCVTRAYALAIINSLRLVRKETGQ